MPSVVETLESRWLLSAGFQAQHTFAAGSQPYSLTVADVNGDGKPDLIVANDEKSGYVSVLLSNGNGTFKAPRTFAAGTYPVSVAVADINGDGLPDIIVANEGGSDIGVLLGNGNGTFRPQLVSAAGSDPHSVAVADVNGDGIPDVIISNYQSSYVSVLLGNGDATFQSPRTFAVGIDPLTVTTADVNGDGRQDLIEVDSYGQANVLLGNGDGTFQAAHTVAVGIHPSSVAVADVNGDGHADLIVTDSTGQAAHPGVSVELGNGNGTFQAPRTFAAGGNPRSVSVADVNGDGHPDLIVANGAGASVLLGNGNGTFQAGQTFVAGYRPYFAAVADLNGDGRPDLAFVSRVDGYVSVLLNDYGGAPTIAHTGDTVSVTGTSFPDIASASVSGSNVILTIDATSDTIPIASFTGMVLDLGAGNDSVNIGAGVPPVTVGGEGGNDSIFGFNIGDSLRGGQGNDLIIATGSSQGVTSPDTTSGLSNIAVGGGGNDTLAGSGAPGEELFGGPGDDVFVNADGSGVSIDGGAGLNFAQENSGDTLTNIFEEYDPNPLDDTPALTTDTVSDTAGGDVLQIYGTTGNDSIVLSTDGQGNLLVNGANPVPEAGLTGILLSGGAGNDTLIVDPGVLLPVTLHGAAGNDSLVGGGGDDVIIGGAGSDTLQGGDGTNLLVPTRRDVFENGSADTDVLIGGPPGSQNYADFSHRTDNLYLANDGMPHGGVTIMPNVQNIFGGSGEDTVASRQSASFLSAGFGATSIASGGANSILVAGPTGAAGDTVVANGSANALFLLNGHADDYQNIQTSDVIQADAAIDSLLA